MALLELARLFSSLFSTFQTRGLVNMIFLQTSLSHRTVFRLVDRSDTFLVLYAGRSNKWYLQFLLANR